MLIFLLLSSAFLHAGWNSITKLSSDKDVFVFFTITATCLILLATIPLFPGPITLGDQNGTYWAIGSGLFEGAYLTSLARSLSGASLAQSYSIIRGGAMVLVWTVSLTLGIEQMSEASLIGSSMILTGILVTGWTRSRGFVSYWPLASAVFVAGYHICYENSLAHGAEPMPLFLVSLLISVPFLVVLVAKNTRTRFKSVLSKDHKKLLITPIAVAASFPLFLYGLRETGPGFAISLRNSSIFFSLGFSLLMGERLTRIQWVGAWIVAAGAFVLSLAGLLGH